ncbi:DNA polymerase III subunit gamma/tau C-terminal domain-containing protein [Taylorella asinigenitalis]|uniref:DNA polymerase III tau subunit domain-containing protein n=1 Tax=Taylorella asinigenitalis (strain MCE3) TaxID=1008459 RepID=G4QBJ6_TAYAM|nr:DNA polymerase III subunit gamma/tau C-terminal domain-containing protein [Taylorella asinigenitalis]AEP36974.1 hypothetical protein TASI_1226 [Taylorella asinigenitalis MCE3]
MNENTWTELVNTYSETGFSHQIAINSEFLKTEGDVIYLKSDIQEVILDKHKTKLEKFLGDYFGRKIQIYFEAGDVKITLHNKQNEEHNARMAEVMKKIESNDFINDLKEHCQAKLIPNSVTIADKNLKD